MLTFAWTSSSTITDDASSCSHPGYTPIHLMEYFTKHFSHLCIVFLTLCLLSSPYRVAHQQATHQAENEVERPQQQAGLGHLAYPMMPQQEYCYPYNYMHHHSYAHPHGYMYTHPEAAPQEDKETGYGYFPTPGLQSNNGEGPVQPSVCMESAIPCSFGDIIMPLQYGTEYQHITNNTQLQ